MKKPKKRFYIVRVQKANGTRAVYVNSARSESEARGKQSAKGMVVSVVQIG